jgi:hypothetical protein
MPRHHISLLIALSFSTTIAQASLDPQTSPDPLASLDHAKPCELSTKADALCTAKIDDLHPTQISVGMIEVKAKEHKLGKMSKQQLDKYLFENPEPAVVGPGGKLYIIDHHHLARALYDIGEDATYCKISANFSDLDTEDFWKKMDENHWVYPYDENGHGPLSYASIPHTVADLKDDPYRSLAAAVRDAGGYDKTIAPFAEFQWADFFRPKISASELEKDFDQAVEMGVKLAQSSEAQDLPGYIGARNQK